MSELGLDRVSGVARWRLFRYLNCAQATLGTIIDCRGLSPGVMVQSVCPLEGGGVSMGSTCGVVSGGCLAIAMVHADEHAGHGAPYHLYREYTKWFDEEFDSTLCRERIGVEVRKVPGFMNYLFTGKVFTRCMDHIGKANAHLAEMVDRPPDESGAVESNGGYCASEVLRGIKEDTGYGDELMVGISTALDGGIGLSGGLCGALAGALLPVGAVWGINPDTDGILGTLVPFLAGHMNMYSGQPAPELWSIGGSLVRGFYKEFGSLECSTIVDRTFEDVRALADFMTDSPVCSRVKDWCRENASRLLTSNPG